MKAWAIAATLLLSSGAAFAADLPSAPAPVLKAAAYAPAFSWTGLYLGGQIGYGWADADSSLSIPSLANYVGASGSPDGFFGGGFVGFNYQFASNIVVGIEADINGGSLDSSNAASSNYFDVTGVTATHELEWFGSVRARLGYAFDRFLPFLTAGYGFGSAKTTYTSVTGGRVSPSGDVSGWTVGGGLEYAVTDNILARIEYRYTDYGDLSSYLPYDGNLTVDHSYTASDLRVGVSYKF